AVLAWNDATVPKIARRIAVEKAFADLPVLGDALEEAGSTSVPVLAHCRRPWRHRRGCWVLDGILCRREARAGAYDVFPLFPTQVTEHLENFNFNRGDA